MLTIDCQHAFVREIKTTSSASPIGLHVVRTGFCSYGRGHTSHLFRAGTTIPINYKFRRNDNVRQTKRIVKFCSIRFYGSGSPCGWNIQLHFLGFLLSSSISLSSSSSFCSVYWPTDHNSQWNLTCDGSNDVVWRKNVPFECPKCSNQLLGASLA